MTSTIILSRKWEFPGQAIATWFLLGIGLCLLLADGYRLYGFASCYGGLLVAPTHLGINFDPSNSRYKTYRYWAGWKVGSWQKLPTVQHVVAKYFAYNQTSRTKIGQTTTHRIEEYVVLLSIKNSKTGIIVATYANLEEAHLTAASIASVLKVDTQVFSPQTDSGGSISIS